MLGLPFFDPTRPPPPPPPLLWNTAPSDDLNFVQNFLSTRQRTEKHVSQKNKMPAASISVLKTRVIDLIKEIEHLTTQKETLEKEICTQPDLEWQTNVEQLELLRSAIESRLVRLNDPELKRKLHARRKKRAWQKRRQAELKRQRDRRLSDRVRLHESIDQWQQEQRKLLDEEKQVQQQLDFAGKFLADVHRRKAACKRYLARFEKIKDMKKQRQLLDKSFSGKDVNESRDDADITELVQNWTTKLADCIKEEKRLKDVLARRSAANFKRRVENEWNRTMFGETIPKKFEHPLLGADRDPEVLIATRWAWDACLVKDDEDDQDQASAIPLGWVLPSTDPLPEWAEYQAKEPN